MSELGLADRTDDVPARHVCERELSTVRCRCKLPAEDKSIVGRHANRQPDWRDVCSQASRFDRAAETLDQGGKTAEAKDGIVIPIAILRAFACELYLKAALIKMNITPKKSHNLGVIFAELPENIRIEIKCNVCNRDTVPEPEFERGLNECGDLFEVWRYLYELTGERTAPVPFLRSFATALLEHLSAR
jgi:hypothetical protein